MTTNEAPFTQAQRVSVLALRHAWPDRTIVLIGAAALACQLDMRWRRTNDLDLTIVAEKAKLAADLLALGWVRDGRIEQRWTSPHGALVDVLPAAPMDLSKGSFMFAESGHVMNLAGFDLALKHSTAIMLDGSTALDVATVPVIVVLKMAAWLDRPGERDRDLEDLAHVLDDYLAPDDMRRWDDALIEAGVAYDDQSAFAVGQDVGAIVGDVHRRIITAFLDAVSDEASAKHTQFARFWRVDASSAVLRGRLEAFSQGIATGSRQGQKVRERR
jgi:predicted nucleotidyltransferase